MSRSAPKTLLVRQVLPLWAFTVAVAFIAGRAFRPQSSPSETASPPVVMSESAPSPPAGLPPRHLPTWQPEASPAALGSREDRLAALKATYITPGLTHLERIRRFIDALDAMSPDELLEARREFENLAQQGYSVNYEVNFMYWKLGETLGGEALEAIKPAGTDGTVTEGVTRSMAAWATKEPAKAVAWFNDLPDGKFRDEMAFWVVDGLCQRDPEEGARFYAGLPIEIQRDKLINMLWLQTHFSGAQGAQKWFTDHVEPANLPEGANEEEFDAFRRTAFAQVSRRLAESSPADAAAWVSSKKGSPLYSPEVVNAVGQMWARTKPSEAKAWMEAHADPAPPQ